MELKNYIFLNRYNTARSFCSAEESKETIKFVDFKDVVKAFTHLINQFSDENKGSYNRWECGHDLSWAVHTQSKNYDTNYATIDDFFKQDGFYKCSGGIPHKYDIEIRKVDGNYHLTLTTYVHIAWTQNDLVWLSEESIKEALIKKMKYLKKQK